MLLVLCAVCLLATASDRATLYEDLGEADGIAAIVERTVAIALEDERIAHTFEETNLRRLEEKLALQFCEVSGGPCTYDGLTMRESHQELGLTSAHFNALVEVLRDAMQEEGVTYRTQNRLLARLAPMKRDIVAD